LKASQTFSNNKSDIFNNMMKKVQTKQITGSSGRGIDLSSKK
jgi:hypothetical protein